MVKKIENGLSDKNVCSVLLKAGLLSKEQVSEILVKKDRIRSKLEQIRNMGQRSVSTSGRAVNPVTIVDIIDSLELKRTDNPQKTLNEETIFQVLAKAWEIPYKKVDPLRLNLDLATSKIPHTFAMKHLILPIEVKDNSLIVATPNPFNMEALGDIAQVSQMRVEPVVSAKSDIIKLINEFFGFKRSIVAAETQFGGPSIDLGNLEQFVRLRSSDELPSTDQHIVNAVDHLFTYAFDQRASDIHIEPKRNTSMVRLRIDGVLHTIYNLPKVVHPAIVSRVKTLSRMDIAEKRRPQDGRIKVSHDNKDAEIRVSTIPVAFGEKVVMRILDPDIIFQDLEGIGFSPESLKTYNNFVKAPHGIILVTGPTGSGKSTTLYSTLKHIATPEKNVITVEDPVEMVHEDFNQIAVQPSIDVTFATILRNILRQDPDIIMIGEIRDLDTATYAIQAALTGHLVFSTLHTNDAISAITRLVDLGVQPFMVSSTLLGAMAQRLVRTLCPHCEEKFTMRGEELRGFGFAAPKEKYTLMRGKGCRECRSTGYLGRSGIFEIFPMSDRLKKMVMTNEPSSELVKVAKQEGMKTLREDAWDKVQQGITSYQEVLRVTGEESLDQPGSVA